MKKQSCFLFIVALTLISIQTINSKKVTKVPKEVIEYMSTRKMRYHHFLWHQIRNLWNLLDEATQKKIKDLGWEPPHPALRYGDYGEAIAEENNYSGEDFLYMHHQMIAQVNKIIQKQCSHSEIQGFQKIPAPGDKKYPVLPVYTIPGKENEGLNHIVDYLKTDEFYWQQIKPAEDAFTDPEVLRSLTLGQLGCQIEFTIHNWLHLRFSQKLVALRPDSGEALQTIDHIWDNSKYNTLLDTYSSHVNKIFWMIHGWVDDRIEDWRKANGLKKIEWKGTWVGGEIKNMADVMGDDLDYDHTNHDSSRMMQMAQEDKEDEHMKNMEKVVAILLATGKSYRYDQKIKVEKL